jgi:uncharacterized protein (TIGR03086 family)
VIDLAPAAQRMTSVLAGISDADFDRSTPCPDLKVGDLIDHVRVFAATFIGSARKQGPRTGPPPVAAAANLGPQWSTEIPPALDELAAAWAEPGAWDGMSSAGPLEVPADMAGRIALDELVVHGWDLAVATGQSYDAPVEEVDGALGFVNNFDVPRDGGLFGPIVEVADDAPPLHRLLGKTGRDPNWRP